VDKTIMGLLGGASALALLGGQASAAAPVDETPGLAPARSFAELLDPIPNATRVLQAEVERARADASGDENPMVVAQIQHHHHHHHHHHHWWNHHHHWWNHHHWHWHHHHHHHWQHPVY
jgi:hypothetical protein